VSGLLEITEKGHGLLRSEARKFKPVPADPYVPADLIHRLQLRMGLMVTGEAGHNKRGPGPLVSRINEVNGKSVAEYHQMMTFGDLTVIDPREKIRLETPGGPASMRIMDLLTPIGRGQRGLIVAPPKTGKTTLLKQIADAALKNHPDMKVFILLIDERPEEVTDFRRSLNAEVWASNSDEDIPTHVRTARMVIERAKRMVECGGHVLVMLDSITRLARAFNHHVGSSGRTMSGGIDAQAMQEPRSMFGSARNIEHGGSLTIIATALVDTGSRMDDVIFEEFKGTGNMEICLDRAMVDKRVFPAINIEKSGTRKEELLLHPDELNRTWLLRRALNGVPPVECMEMVIKRLKNTKSNAEFLMGIKE